MIVSRSHGAAATRRCRGAAPQVDDELALDRDGDRRALVVDRVVVLDEVGLEGLLHGLESFVAGPFDTHGRNVMGDGGGRRVAEGVGRTPTPARRPPATPLAATGSSCRALAASASGCRVIEAEEWHHREIVAGWLDRLGERPRPRRERAMGAIGRVFGAVCFVPGEFFPMYFAGSL